MTTTLRQLTPDDWQLWREVRLAALAEAPDAFGSRLVDWQDAPESRWRDRLGAVALNLVAVVDGRPAGQVSGGMTASDKPAELISMWVAPEHRGEGVGDALVRAVVEWAAEKGATEVALTVRVGNASAIDLYRRCGFVDAELADVDAGEPPERWMRRPLPERPVGEP